MQAQNRIIATFLILLSTLLSVWADSPIAHKKNTYFVSGIVRDGVTYEPIPYASVTCSGKGTGALTNESGIFELTLDDNANELIVNCLGYEKANVKIQKGRVNLYDIKLTPSTTQLQELVVKRQKYSKKNNPAVDFANKLRADGPLTDPERNDYYNYQKHQVITLALNDFGQQKDNSFLSEQFPFLWEHVDTSEISGKPILNLVVKEKTADVHYRKSPKARKEVIKAIRQEGMDAIADQDGVQSFLDEVMREINLYDNDINILNNRFVSPLSKIAPDFYRFYLTDTVSVDSQQCVVLSFYPRNPAAAGFNGQVFVPLGDSTMFVKKVTMRTPRNINLNFIQNLFISQEFERAADGSRLKIKDDLTAEVSPISQASGIYARRNVAYDNHTFQPAADEAVYAALGETITEKKANARTEEYWNEARLIEITDNEKSVGKIMDQMRDRRWWYWLEKALRVISIGYIEIGHPSKFDFGPITSIISHNSIEGWRLRAGGLTTAHLNNRLLARGYVAYGCDDHRWKYKAEGEYSFIDKEQHSREFPMRALRISSMYDIDQMGQHYLNDYADNIFTSLRRMTDNHASYHYVNKIEGIWELNNHLSLNLAVRHEIQEASRTLKFVDGYGKNYTHYPETSLDFTLRWAPGEKFYQTRTHREPINRDALVITLAQRYAPKGWLGSTFEINTTELSVEKRIWMSVCGYLDVTAKGGHVWSLSPFPSLFIPNVNLSYIIQRNNYDCMNPMEFINDTYGSIYLYYHPQGAILNHIPLVKKLKLREIFSFKALWGTLSSRNDPSRNPNLLLFPAGTGVSRLGGTPYMEVSAGLDNILKIFKIEYVWRLSYLDVPYKIDRSGLRVAAKLTF